MKCPRRPPCAAGLLGLLFVLLSSGLATAEISTDPTDSGVVTILMGTTEGPDPVDPTVWQPVRQIPPGRILNAEGALRGDGRPDIAWHPSSGWPIVVWAWNVGEDRDIAFSEWDGTTWSAVAFLTSGTTDDLDPRVFIAADGAVTVVWWSAGPPDAVYATTREAGMSGWSAPVQVTASGESGRRPSVATFDDALWIAYERTAAEPGIAQEVVAAERQTDGTFVPQTVAGTARVDRLDAILHAENGILWVDWKSADEDFGHASAIETGWNPPEATAWPDPSWLGVEGVRRTIRLDTLAP